MSAICGIVSLNQVPVPIESLTAVMSSLSHLGPDGSGIWMEGGCGIGHQMIHITPESLNEELPYQDSEAGLVITADARLDNRDDLLEALCIPSLEGRGLTDSILIIRSFQKWGEDCVHHFLGDFVFALWDHRKCKMILVTDHMGMRPVYYWQGKDSFVFATEIKGILAFPGVQTRLDMEKLAMQVIPGLQRLDKSRTFFENIRRAPAAAITNIEKGVVSHRTYWELEMPEPLTFKREDEFAEAFQDVFSQAVRARMRSAFPVAALLSGGLDSSAVVGMASRIRQAQNRRLFTFSAVLPEGYYGSGTDERSYIDLFKSFENIDLMYTSNGERGPFDDLDSLVWGGEQPGYMSRHYQYSAFAEAVKEKGCRVILDGVGGEIGPSFHGDGIMAEWLLHRSWLLLARELRKRTVIESRSIWGLMKGELIKPLLPGFIMNSRPRFDIYQSFETSPVIKSFAEKYLGSDLIEQVRGLNQQVRTAPDHRQNQLRAVGFFRGSAGGNDYVGYEQVRMLYPFFDRRVLDLCIAAPGHLKIHNGYNRNLLRAGMKGILPESIRFRTSKEPFGPDFHDRYNRQRPQVQEYLSRISKNDPVRRIVDVAKLQQMATYQMVANRCDTPADFAAMHSLPQGIYLIAFLKRFEAYWR